MNRKERIEKILREHFHPSLLIVQDESDRHAEHLPGGSGESHYSVTIVADAFRGKSKVAAHRLIFEALDSEMTGTYPIHALSIQVRGE